MKRAVVVLILVFAFFGLADSAYLAQHAASGTPLLCDIENLSGCNTVASSEYSRVFGIPLAQFGVLFYGILFVFAALEMMFFNERLRRVLQILALVGVIASAYFTFIQAFVIEAFCIYCLASAVTALLIFILATLIEPIRKPSFMRKRDKPSLPMPPTT